MNIFTTIKAYSKLKKNLSYNTPVLQPHILKNIVKKYFDYKEKYLNILEDTQAPLYILETSVLTKQADTFRNAFNAYLQETEYYYAVKSNNHPAVSRTMLNSGYGLEVSSGKELEQAIELGAKKIIFNGPGKTDEELTLAILNSEKVIVLMDSIGEFVRLEGIAQKYNKKIRTGIRVITTSKGLWQKFGISPEQLTDLWDKIQKSKTVVLQGLQFHSSWNLTPTKQVNMINRISEIIKDRPTSFINALKFIDIGGGYWPNHGEWIHYSTTPVGTLRKALGFNNPNYLKHYTNYADNIKYFAEEISKAIIEKIYPVCKCKVFFEPGRWICNDSMHLILSVVDKKNSNTIVTDAGTNAIGWERFETDYFPVLNLSRPSLKEQSCNIYGSLCTPHDIWGFSYWGSDINVGDILMIPMQGAYTYSLRQNFIKPLPKVVVL